MANRLVNSTTVKQGLYATSSTANGDIGSVMEFEDGRKFIYALNGSTDTLVPADFLQAPVEISTDENITIITDVAVGDKTIELESKREYTVNELKDGWVIIDDGEDAQVGHSRKIRSHDAVTSTGDDLILTVYDAWTDTADANGETVAVVENPYSGVIKNNAATDGTLLGVAVCDVPQSYYFWLQVAGPGPVKVGNVSDITVGMSLSVIAVEGMVLKTAGGSDEIVGHAMRDVGTAYDRTMAWLNLR